MTPPLSGLIRLVETAGSLTKRPFKGQLAVFRKGTMVINEQVS